MTHFFYLRAVRAAVCTIIMFVATSAMGQEAAPVANTRNGGKAVTVTLSPSPSAPELAPLFLGLSYEMRIVLPENGKYYFDSEDENLLGVYRTLGIKSLRVGANAVDDPRVAVPDTKDIDALFAFAKKAGVKVVYSFRLKKGDASNAARLADYISKNYADTLDCFSIGNEPDFYLKTYGEYREAWKPIYEAVIKAVPDAKLIGPSTSRKSYVLEFADEFFPTGRLAHISTHTYALGNGRQAEKDPPAARARFLSNKTLAGYQRLYDNIVKPLEAKKIPYRLGETNSCFGGGAKDISDSYASTLWVLDYLNWWAGRHILGLNFHTGDTVNGYPIMQANYAVFVHKPGSREFDIRPMAYGVLAFSQAARGKAMDVKVEGAAGLDFTAYAYEDQKAGQSIMLLNKTQGQGAQPITVRVEGVTPKAAWQSMTLQQASADIAAKSGVALGASAIDPKGKWEGKWSDVSSGDEGLTVTIKATSAMVLRAKAGG